ncbi:DM13 domain-containing protein [Vibrio sp. ZSDE26]|uniref:DM13 domain-containing protein n=1 Tax=Vibrio amylolyticus TaxID=2847292 RepID=A0A9X1XSV0_9VIBR|nr:DM13 domain-containing protein [Vibrio amylolyticus]MCK6264924.1 DM13 domain-containing protein [Vibrio amylolyticus]
MKSKTWIVLVISHLGIGAFGFALGIYMLPILIAPSAPTASEITSMSSGSLYSAQFERNRQDSDRFHWGEGKLSIGAEHITFEGELAPGPDYKLYLSNVFVETEADFERLKSTMMYVGDIKTFDNFVVDVPLEVDPSKYSTAIVWCETFGEFITSAQYQ